jgi:hypothetical protein
MAGKFNFNSSSFKFLLVMFLFVLLLIPYAEASVIGASPGRLKFNQVLQGGYAENFVRITVGDQDNISVISRIISDDLIEDWIIVNEGRPLYVNSDFDRVKIQVQPPIDARPGNYSGRIQFILGENQAELKGSSGSIVRSAIEVIVDISVTGDEYFSCTASAFRVRSTEIQRDSSLSLRIFNSGNVRISPRVFVTIFDQWQTRELYSFDFTASQMLPTTESVANHIFNPNLPSGQYWAKISVPECMGSSGTIDFSILDRGAIEDKGELLRIRNNPWAFAKEFVVIDAIFSNTGSTQVDAQFKGQVRLDGKIISQLESDIIRVNPGTEQPLEMLFQPPEEGRYVISGRVLYNMKITSDREAILNVRAGTSDLPILWIILIGIGYVLALALAIYLIMLFRKRSTYRS